MITADKARELAGPTAQEYVEQLSPLIEEAARKKNRYVVVRAEPFSYWLYGLFDVSDAAKGAMEILRENGFTLSLHYQELQFVDMGLRISWE